MTIEVGKKYSTDGSMYKHEIKILYGPCDDFPYYIGANTYLLNIMRSECVPLLYYDKNGIHINDIINPIPLSEKRSSYNLRINEQ